MRGDLGQMLTVTGVIATLVAAFFGVAALYVQHKKREQERVDERPPPPKEPETETDVRDRIRRTVTGQEEPAAASSEQEIPSTSTLFKRYTGSGEERPFGKTENGEEYVWE